jgi:hypothetical protein
MAHEDISLTARPPEFRAFVVYLMWCTILAINFYRVDNMIIMKDVVGRHVSSSSERSAVTFEHSACIEISSVHLQVKVEGSRYCVISEH